MAEILRWQQKVQARVPHWRDDTHLAASQMKNVRLVSENGFPVIDTEGFNPAGVLLRWFRAAESGGRKGRIVNISSYDMVKSVYPETLGFISAFRDAIHPYDQETTPQGVSNTLNAVDGFALFSVLRSDGPIEAYRIPNHVAAASKLVSGPIALYTNFQLVEFGIDSEPKKGNALYRKRTHKDSVVNEVFRGGYLRSSNNNRACPATEKDIVELATVLFHEPSEPQATLNKRLGLMPDELERVIVFGNSLRQAKVIGGLFKDFRKTKKGEPVLAIQDEDNVRPIREDDFLRIGDILVQRMNVALGREPSPLVVQVAAQPVPAAFRSTPSRFPSR